MSIVIATVNISHARYGLGVEVRFDFPQTGESVHLPVPDRSLLDVLAQRAGTYMERLVHAIPRLNVAANDAEVAMHLLLQAGWELADTLVQSDPSRSLQLQRAFRRAWPVWHTTEWDDDRDSLPIVEMYCHDTALPLEILPLFDFSPLPMVRTGADLAKAASRFLGFSTVVKRVLSNPTAADHILRNDPALPMQFIRHRRLPSTAEEANFLLSLEPFVRIDGPWPATEDEEAVTMTLAQALYDGSPLMGRPTPGLPVQIQHLSCHCDTTSERHEDFTLRLSTRAGMSRTVTFGRLRNEHWARYYSEDGATRVRAVIVLNACASSRISPATAVSFPQWFLKCGHRAYVGTESNVPDLVASAFSQSFYGRLLERRRPMGEAMVLARRDLLRDYRNPLGLLYVMYGDTELVVERARPGIYRSHAKPTH